MSAESDSSAWRSWAKISSSTWRARIQRGRLQPDSGRTEEFTPTGQGQNVVPTKTLKELVDARRPRKVMLMVRRAPPLMRSSTSWPFLSPGESSSTEVTPTTRTRCGGPRSSSKGVHSWAWGFPAAKRARSRAQHHAGRIPKAWEKVRRFSSTSPRRYDGVPCCDYLGGDGAGHFVKMVHNGIEYGDMQLICEATS